MKNNLLKGLLVFLTMVFTGFAQAQSVSGKISDSSGPLPGASVTVKGTTNSVQSDLDGNYAIKNVGNNAVLVFSYIGLKSQEINVAGKTVINVVLKDDKSELKEVVVIGYGSVKKKDATGAVEQISSKKFDNVAATSPAEILRGKVAGVQITTSSGEPGASTSIRIRGNGSLRSGNGPLIVVDGVPLDGGDTSAGGADILGASTPRNSLNFINQNDIESMSILKDASSTAIYGSRGANGVIMITTKKSKSKEPQLSFNSSVGFSNYKGKVDVMSSSEYLANGGTNKGGSYNWKDTVLRTGTTFNNDVAYSTGTENSSTRISLGASNTEGIVKNTGIDKYTLSLNNSTDFFNKTLKVDTRLSYAGLRDHTTMLSRNAGYIGNIIGSALYWNPTLSTLNANGSYNVVGDDYLNPQQLLDSYIDYTNTNKLIASINSTLKLSNSLKYNFVFGIETSVSSRKSQILPSIRIKDVAQATYNGTVYYGQANISNVNKYNKTFEHTLTYFKEFNPNVSLEAIGGFSYYDYNFNGNNVVAKGFDPNQVNLIDNIQGGVGYIDNKFGPTSSRNEVELQSTYARLTSNLYKKVSVNATIRRDGSSKFGANNKYGTFYSFGAAYKLVESKDGLVNDVKIRGNYGSTGNQEFAANSALYYANYVAPSTFGNQISASPDLKWETTKSYGIGVDFTLLKNKLTGSLDYFNRKTYDLIFTQQAASNPIGPNSTKYINLKGYLENKGFEVALNYKIIDTEKFTWDVSANASFLSNKLNDFQGYVNTAELNGQGLTGASAQIIANNLPIYTYYLYDFKGYDASGASIYTDAAGNNTSLATASKQVLDKTPLPKVNLGFTTGITYNNFDAAVSFYGAFGHYIYNNTANALFFKGAFPVRNIPLSVATSTQNTGDPNSPSTKYLEKGDFLRMGNITLGYTFSGGIFEKAKIKSARFYVNAQNLLLFTNYSGFDPEVDTYKTINGVPSAGIDYLSYPKSKTVLFGINLNF